MKYIFNVNEDMNNGRDKEKNIMKIYLFFYDLVQNHKLQIIGLIASFLLLYLSSYRLAIILKIILAISISGFVFSVLDLYFSTQRLYDKISKFIDYDLYVRDMIVFNDSINDRLEESSIVPAIKICYDVRNVSNKKFALIFNIDNQTYKIAEIINCEKKENKIEKKIYSDKLLRTIQETDNKCVNEKGLLLASIVLLKDSNKREGEIITENDIDNSLILSELFFIPYLHESDKEIDEKSN